MLSCTDFAHRIGKAFPATPNVAPAQNWLAKLLKSNKLRQTEFSQVVMLDWNPNKVLLSGHIGMMMTRIAILLASGQFSKIDSMIYAVEEEKRFRLSGKACLLIKYSENVLLQSGDDVVLNISLALGMAGYYTLLIMADQSGEVEFPLNDRCFKGKITPSFDAPKLENDREGYGKWAMCAASRIELFARISARCSVYGPLFSEDANPSDMFSEAMQVPTMPIAAVVGSIPLIDLTRVSTPPNIGKFFPRFFESVMQNTYLAMDDLFVASLPQNLPAPSIIRNEIANSRAYEMWPGISDVQWSEASMRGIKILQLPSGIYISVVRYVDPEGNLLERMIEIPALNDEISWRDVEQEEIDHSPYAIELSPAMEVIRMCVAPAETKIRDNRVPTGYVSGTRKPSTKKGDVPVIYLPKIKTIAMPNDSDTYDSTSPSGLTGRAHRGHQVTGFLRQLPIDHKASDTARTIAEQYGIKLPDSGYTFVRPHARGKFEGIATYKVSAKRLGR